MILSPLGILLKNRRYRWFWSAYTLSTIGDAFTRLALTWFVYDTTKSATAVGLLLVAYSAPLIVGGFVAGWALDRFDRRWVMIVDSIVRGGAIAAIPVLYWLDLLELWHIYCAAAVYGFFVMIVYAGIPTLIPALTVPEERNAANALETLSFTVGGVVGPAIAGLLIARFGAPPVIVLDVFTYLGLALVLVALPRVGGKDTAKSTSISFTPVFRLLLTSPVLLATTLMFATFNIGEGLMLVWLPILCLETLGGGAALYGLLLAALGVGETLGAMVAGMLSDNRLGMRICQAQAISGIALLAIFVRPTTLVLFAGLVLLGFAGAPMTVWAQTLRMHIIPVALRGRAFALLRLTMQAGGPVGSAIGGFLIPAVGLIATIGVSAGLVGLPAIAGLNVRALRNASPLAPETD